MTHKEPYIVATGTDDVNLEDCVNRSSEHYETIGGVSITTIDSKHGTNQIFVQVMKLRKNNNDKETGNNNHSK